MSLTNFGEAAALDAVLTTTNKWLALFTVAPGETGGGTEVSGGSYARQAVTWAAAAQGAPSTKANSGAVAFGPATADWAAGATTISYWAIFDAASAGNMVWYGQLLAADGVTPLARNVYNGDSLTFANGQLIAKMD